MLNFTNGTEGTNTINSFTNASDDTRWFMVGEIMPQEDLFRMQKMKDDFTSIEFSGGILVAQIVMEGITKKQLKAFHGDLTIIYQDYEIPFLVFKYKKMSFEVPIIAHVDFNQKISASHLCIQVVERKNHVLKSLCINIIDF